jgi:carboxypeptidase Taq
MNPEQAYAELVQLSRETTIAASCLQLLNWDEEIVMPRGGVAHRADQSSFLAGIVHDRSTNPRYGELLEIIEGSPLVSDPDSPQAVNVREMRRNFDRERKLPKRLVEEFARIKSMASQTWAEAKTNDDFKSFAPLLDKMFELAREECDAVGFETERYDALLDVYEPGMTTPLVSKLFAELEPQLVPLVSSVRDNQAPPREDILTREFPIERQRSFMEEVAGAIGFNLEGGRLDPGNHPFCTMIGPGDVRLSLWYLPQNFSRGFLALTHEVGHALYEQGLPPEHYGTPMGEARSLGVHESQSRMWENHVGRSVGFWKHFYPRLLGAFPETLSDVPLDTFRAAINHVSPGLIRVGADEVTYDLHIMIRFDLERALLSGNLTANDVPGAWAELYSRRLGVTPKDDRTGCLQDIHWAAGLIGYFPTYTLGNVYAAQLYAAAEEQVGPLEEAFERGDFTTLREWLRENIHRQGQRYRSPELIERATGRPPDPSAMIDSLTRRYRLGA